MTSTTKQPPVHHRGHPRPFESCHSGKIFAGVQNIPVEDDHIPFLRRGERGAIPCVKIVLESGF